MKIFGGNMKDSRKESQRTEFDALGPVLVPSDAYFGASTARAIENFTISSLRFPRTFIRALGLIKWAAARVNWKLGLFDDEVAVAVSVAACEVALGKHDSEFLVDVFQTGSGTSTNMNANEVIANRASELLEGALGRFGKVNPNDHVNYGQSSNDVIPTACHLAVLIALEEDLIPALAELRNGLQEKEEEFWNVIKTGRTHLQDAVPIRLGQEFQGYKSQIELSLERLARAKVVLREVALGGTAVGTGLNAHPQFAKKVCRMISKHLKNNWLMIQIKETRHHFQAQNTMNGLLEASAALRAIALDLFKIANDLAWMNSGPMAGLGEIRLPELQPGSSIMPGKVNPVIPEAVKQVSARVVGNDATVAFAGREGFFELNTMWPIAIYATLESIALLANAARTLNDKCVTDIRATTRGLELMEKGFMLATALVPRVGYKKAVEIVQEAQRSGRAIREVAMEHADLSEQELDKILDAQKMA